MLYFYFGSFLLKPSLTLEGQSLKYSMNILFTCIRISYCAACYAQLFELFDFRTDSTNVDLSRISSLVLSRVSSEVAVDHFSQSKFVGRVQC